MPRTPNRNWEYPPGNGDFLQKIFEAIDEDMETAISGGETPTLAEVLATGNAANAKITNITDPTSDYDAATKHYVDTHTGGVPTTRLVETRAPLSGGGDLSEDRTISIQQSSYNTDGYLSYQDWNLFNSKIDLDSLSAIAPLYYDVLYGEFEMSQSSYNTDGWLSYEDWNAFNNKLDSCSLDDAYSFGQSIIADLGAVEITVPDGADNVALELTQNDATNNPIALLIDNQGTGSSIELTGSTRSIVSKTNLTIQIDSKGYIATGAGGAVSIGNTGRELTLSADSFGITASATSANMSFILAANVALARVIAFDADNANVGGSAGITFSDSWQKDSSGVGGYSTSMPYASSATEWTTFKTNFGEVSLLNAVNQCAPKPGGFTWIEKSTPYTAVNGEGILANTSGGGWTLTLPASPTIGDTVGISDSRGTFDTNNLTIARNGSLIQGVDEDLVCDLQDSSFVLIYSGATTGWKIDTYISQASGVVLTRFIDLTGDSKHTTGTATSGGGTTSSHFHVTISNGIVCGLRVRAIGNTTLSNIEFFSDSGLTRRIYYAVNKDCYTSPYHADYNSWCIPQFNGPLVDNALYYTITNNGSNDSTYEIEMTLIGEA
jgi:hypothetical protein